MKQIIKRIADEADIHAPIEPIHGTDIQIMVGEDGKEYIFVFNYSLDKASVLLQGEYYDVLNNCILENSLNLNEKGYACIM